MTNGEIQEMQEPTSTDETETSYRNFFLTLYQNLDELLKEVEAVAEIPKKNGINHFRAICRPGRRSTYLLVCDRIRRSLDKIVKDPGTIIFFLPDVFVDNDKMRKLNAEKKTCKRLASDQYIVSVGDDGLGKDNDYISLADLIDGLVSRMTSLVEWLEMRHVTKDDISIPLSLVRMLRNACYLSYVLLPASMEGYVPDTIRVFKEL